MATPMHGYFDYNASSLLRPQAAAALAAWIDSGGGNPSSMHARGRRARIEIEDARRSVASLADGAVARDVVFTSGATESNNTVLRGFAAAMPEATLVTSVVEHHSLVATVDDLETRGHRIVRLAARSDSSLDLAPLASLGAGPVLVSLGLANGESGAILAVDSLLAAAPAGAFVHLDVAQAAGRLLLPFGGRIDALSMSGHKFGSPPGIGALVVSPRLRGLLRPLLTGGPQEWSMRAGTPNVPGIVAMGAAARASLEGMDTEQRRLAAIRNGLWQRLRTTLPGIVRITPDDGLANTLTIALEGCSADSLIAALDLEGFCISAGSACAAGSPEPSHVMKALGLAPQYHGGVLRISAGWGTQRDDADALADALERTIRRARQAA
ncbi:MAG TPA: aminotransferase class V-fold PLP-dependent enzyme [Candidatus Binatia bacterium]|jgi:cysteine desulfurase